MDGDRQEFQFLITRGRTSFPVRPLEGTRCTIGGGAQCQLQLGGKIPMVHSVLQLTAHGWELEAIAPTPLLFVNGQSVRKLLLQPNDEVSIGDFSLQYQHRHAATSTAEVVKPPAIPEPVPVADAVADSPEELSVSGLVDRLETAMQELESLETKRKQGWESLLAAARSANDEEQPVEAEPIQSDPWEHLEAALEELTSKVNELHQREADLLKNAKQMETQQEQLLEQIRQIRQELADQRGGPNLKISA